MCIECGCGRGGDNVKIGGSHHEHGHDHAPGSNHSHAHDHGHHHVPDHSHDLPTAPFKLDLNRSLLEKNDRFAERNRGYFQAKKLLVLNVVSSPGTGKTTFIRETAARLKGRIRSSSDSNHHRDRLSSGLGNGVQSRRPT